jgi:hypothetical protein
MKALRGVKHSARVGSDLQHVIYQFQQWRVGRQKLERIPEPLWQAAASLHPRYSVFRIARSLRLNFNDMRDRIHGKRKLVRGQKHSRSAVAGAESDRLHFVEMPAAAVADGEECQLKVRIGAGGIRMNIRLKGAGVGQMLERLRGLWSLCA